MLLFYVLLNVHISLISNYAKVGLLPFLDNFSFFTENNVRKSLFHRVRMTVYKKSPTKNCRAANVLINLT